jgi:hypothetical protein
MLGKNWKTSLFGLLGAVCIAIYPIIQSGKIDPHALIMAIAVAVIGFLAKDFNVTGGTIRQ